MPSFSDMVAIYCPKIVGIHIITTIPTFLEQPFWAKIYMKN